MEKPEHNPTPERELLDLVSVDEMKSWEGLAGTEENKHLSTRQFFEKHPDLLGPHRVNIFLAIIKEHPDETAVSQLRTLRRLVESQQRQRDKGAGSTEPQSS